MPRLLVSLLILSAILTDAGAHGQFDLGNIDFRLPLKVDVPPISRSYAPKHYHRVMVYRAKTPVSKGLVVIVGDGYLPGHPVWFNDVKFVQRLIDDGYTVAYPQPGGIFKEGMTESVRDVALAIAFVYANPEVFRASGPLVVIGVGDGAAHAGLIGTDPELLKTAGVAFERLRATILVNAKALDGPAIVAASSATYRKRYLRGFGPDESAQRASSMIGHVGGVDAPAFYILNEEEPKQLGLQAIALAPALREGGAIVTVETMPRPSGSGSETLFGDEDNAPSMKLLSFIEERVAQPAMP